MPILLLLLACSTDLPTFLETYPDDPTGGVPTPVEPAEPAAPVYDEAAISEVLAKLIADDAAAKAEAFKAFPTVDVDEVSGRKYREPKAAPKFINSRSSVHAMVVTDMADTVKIVTIRWAYVADDWLFFDRATIAAGDFRSQVTFDSTRRDNGGGEIWEFANLLIPSGDVVLPGMAIDRAVAAKMTDPGKVIIRLEGREHYDDYEMKAWEKASIQAALVLAKDAPTRDDAIALLASRPPEVTP